tara:strand:- start:366 stop:1094 length:729 start_codon:yes stop_codon:yes gene_type:complete
MFVAEIGINHKGDKQRAFAMLEQLVNTNVDAVTFQIPRPEFYSKNKKWGDPLDIEFYVKAIDFVHNKNKKIGFATGVENIIPYLDKNGADFWKFLSVHISIDGLCNAFKKTNKLILISTGVSDEKEILNVVKQLKDSNIRLIHTQLSNAIEDTNLKAIKRLREITNKEISFGLHCSEYEVLFAAISFEPTDIIFYVKDNKSEEFPDGDHAIVIDQVDKLIEKLNGTKKALGSGIKNKIHSQL